jgi:hypothetical protein
MKMRENMYQSVLSVTPFLLLLALLTFVYREECNMSYLLHVEEDVSGSSGNPANEAGIDVDYDALEASI